MPDVQLQLGFTCNQLINDGILINGGKIELVKKWLNANKLPKLIDEQIVLFLQSCNNDVEFTMETIKAYFCVKYGGHEIFANRSSKAEDVQKAFAVGAVCLSPRRTSEGCAVIFYKIKNNDYWGWSLKDTAKILFMAIECVIFEYPAKGLIIVVDLDHMIIKHLLRLRPRPLKIIFDYLQEALPVKLNYIHVINTPYFLNQLLAIINPFINKELFEKIKFHPKDVDWNMIYDEYVPKDVMCKDYGGDLASFSDMEKQTIDKFTQMEPYFKNEELLRQKK